MNNYKKSAPSAKGNTKAVAKSNGTVSVSCRLWPDRYGAHGYVVLNDAFSVMLNVREGAYGPFISWPSYKANDGSYKDYAHPVTKAAHDAIVKSVMAVYNSIKASEDSESESEDD